MEPVVVSVDPFRCRVWNLHDRSGRKPKQMTHDQIVKTDAGMPLFRIRHQRDSIALLLPIERTSAASLEAIQQDVAHILQGSVLEESKRGGSKRDILQYASA